MTKPYRRPFAFPIALALAALTASCGGDVTLPDEGEAAQLDIIEGNPQVGPVGAALAAPLVVRVLDTDDRPVPNQTVTFVIESGGSVEPETKATDEDGLASATWTLGPVAGSQTLRARTPRGGGSEFLEVQFTATAVAGSGSVLVGVTGDDQVGPVNSALADSLVVKATDAFGNPVANVEVTWSVSGGGSISPATVVTGTDGLAAAERVLGANAGSQSAQATVEGFTGSPVTFSHTAEPANPTALVVISGDDQSAPAGFEVAGDLVVRLEDPNKNGIGARPITWVVPAGAGSVSPINTTTDPNGLASTRWTLPATVGEHTVSAVFSGLPPVVFSATATADVPAEIEMVSGNGQSAPVGAALTNPLVVRVTDASGNPVSGVSVAWTAVNGGEVNGGATANTATNGEGLAQVTRTLGLTPGQYSTTAAVEGLQGSPINFVSTATVGAPAQLALLQAPGSPTVSGTTFSPAPIIQVQDAQGNAVPQGGIPIVVTIVPNTGQPGATLENDTRNTNLNGRVTFSTLRISGAPDTDYALIFTASFAGAPLTPVSTDSLVVTAGGANRLVILTQPSTSAQSGVPFAQQPVVQVQDATGNPIEGARNITASIESGGGTLQGTVTLSTGTGSTATFTNLAISGAVGSRTLLFSSGALTPAESNPINVTTGPPAIIELEDGDDQSALAGEALPDPLVVRVTDASGNPVSGVSVAWTALNGGSVNGAPTANTPTNAQGFAQVTRTLGPTAGEYSTTAEVDGLQGSPVTFVSTAAAQSTTTTLSLQPPSPVTSGTEVTMTATVESSGGTPTGTVSFRNNGSEIGTGTLNGSGVATFQTTALSATQHSLTAHYLGNATFSSSASDPVTYEVTAVVQGTTTTLSVAPPSPVTSGAQVTMTATVESSGGTPTGTVSFRDNGSEIGTGTLDGSGIATFQTTSLSVAQHSFTAHYLGDASFSPSESGPTSYEVAASNAPPTATPDLGLTVNEDETLTVPTPGVLANDDDADDDPLTAQLFADAASGQLALAANGGFVYTPDQDFNGSDQFQYRASDGAANSAPATVSINVIPVNDDPLFTPGGDIEVNTVEALAFSEQWATGIDPGPPDETEDVAFEVSLVESADEDALPNPPQISNDGTLSFNALPLNLLTPRNIPVRVVLTDTAGGRTDEVIFTITITPVLGP